MPAEGGRVQKNVATPGEAAQAQQQIENIKGRNKFNRMRNLRPADRRMLEHPPDDIYIYNASPIFRWERPVYGKGTLIISKAPWYRVGMPVLLSEEILIKGAITRGEDIGMGRHQPYVEDGLEIAEDILQCSKQFGSRPENSLINYGCFMLIGSRFAELSEEDQRTALDEAAHKHETAAREMVLTADRLSGSTRSELWITEPYRQAALFLGEERDWCAKRGKTAQVEECPFCGYENKRGVPKCRNCSEIIDQDAYEALKQQVAAKKKQKAAKS